MRCEDARAARRPGTARRGRTRGGPRGRTGPSRHGAAGHAGGDRTTGTTSDGRSSRCGWCAHARRRACRRPRRWPWRSASAGSAAAGRDAHAGDTGDFCCGAHT